jgi:hypothetical protein
MFERRRATRKREKQEREERVQRLREKRDMLRALMLTYEHKQSFTEMRRLKVRLRTTEQQLRYINNADDFDL